jgi:hypothetical protein
VEGLDKMARFLKKRAVCAARLGNARALLARARAYKIYTVVWVVTPVFFFEEMIYIAARVAAPDSSIRCYFLFVVVVSQIGQAKVYKTHR